MAYFHEPNFEAVARPLFDPAAADEFIHYGTHFTNMFMRCYPERITTARIEEEDRLTVLERLRQEALNSCTRPRRAVSWPGMRRCRPATTGRHRRVPGRLSWGGGIRVPASGIWTAEQKASLTALVVRGSRELNTMESRPAR